MITDIHTHLLDFDSDCTQAVRKDMARCGISQDAWRYTHDQYLAGTAAADRAVVFGLKASKTGWNTHNETVASFVEKHREKYVFFAAIDPLDPAALEELRYCHETLKCRGVKLGPVYQGVHPLDPINYAIYGYCEKNHLPIMTHMATTFSSGVPLEYARPIHMDQVSCDFPDLKIVLAHLGHPWVEETLAVIRKQPNVYADISALYYRPWQFYNAMLLAVEYGCCAKIMFGSDFPATTTADSIAGVRKVNGIVAGTSLPAIPAEVIEQILGMDSLAALNISD